MIDIVNTVIRRSNMHKKYASKQYYSKLIKLVEEMEEDVNLSFCNWLYAYITNRDLVPYNWYNETLDNLKSLEKKAL